MKATEPKRKELDLRSKRVKKENSRKKLRE
jgi:hypothetical protein